MSKALDALLQRADELQSKVAKVGWFEGTRYTDDGMSVAEVAVIQEFGAPAAHIPPRPFMNPTIEQNKELWADNLAKGARAVLAGKITEEQVLDQVGGQAAGQIRKTISEVREPELAESTLAQRRRDGFTDQPLNRTGYMIATCTHIVGKADEE